MRILIVDDEEGVREILRETLRQEGFAVDTADCGERGLYFALTNDYDALVLDNRLPDKSGIELVRIIRKAGRIVPILILSALDDSRFKSDLLNAGADDYLAKPYSFEELLARIRALIRRGRPIQHEELQVGDLSLNSREHWARWGKNELPLTRKEFSLLEYMMHQAGAVLTRGMIMEHVWDMNADPFSNTVESHIASLRRKMNAYGGDSSIIKTISGRGYKIDGNLKEL